VLNVRFKFKIIYFRGRKVGYEQAIVVNIKALHRKIIHYFGARAEKIYGLAA